MAASCQCEYSVQNMQLMNQTLEMQSTIQVIK